MTLYHCPALQLLRRRQPLSALDVYRSRTVKYSSNDAVIRKAVGTQHKTDESRRHDAPQGKDERPPAGPTNEKGSLATRLSQWTHASLSRHSQNISRREIAASQAQPEHTRRVAEQLQHSPENTSQILINCIDSGHVVPQQTIALCLKHAFGRRQEKDEGPIARPILKYILEDSNRWLPLLLDSNDGSRTHLCYFAILEGLERIVQDLCMVDVKEQEFGRQLTLQERNVWRGNLFGALVRAHTHLTPGNADSAMRAFFEVIDRRQKRFEESGIRRDEFARDTRTEAPGIVTLPLWSATMFLIKTIANGRLVSTDSALYGRFEAFHCYPKARSKSTPEQHAWHRACLALFRPNSPDQQPMIALLRKLIRDHRIEQRGEGNPIPDMLQTAWAIRAIKRTHEIALRNGNAQDADWLADTFGENVQFWSLSNGGIAASGKFPRSKT